MADTSPTAHRVVFTPAGVEGTALDGTTVLDAARRLGVDLDSVCGGRGICGRCQVTPSVGRFAKWSISAAATHLSERGQIETGYRGRRTLDGDDRLGCGAHIVGDVVIDVPARSQIHKQVVRKQVDLGDLELDPIYTLHYLHLDDDGDADGPQAGSAVSERLTGALSKQWAIEGVTVDVRLLDDLHAAVATGSVTVALAHAETVVGIWPGFIDRAFGIAVDIGSTTVAGHLCDLATGEILASAGRMNPQIRFGEDLMSRVSYAMMNDDGAEAMTSAIRTALDELITELVADATTHLMVESAEGQHDLDDGAPIALLDIVAVGNPIMHHVLLGIDPTPLGQSPFPLATADPLDLTAEDLGLSASVARVHLPPCIAGHVGADTTAAILSEGPHRGDGMQLLVDVGTNAEIVLGNRDRLFAASSPTGPAFEGAQISSGQRATAGAIERVRIDRQTLEPRYRVIGSDQWSDEPGFDAAATFGAITGICGSGIIEVISELFLAGVIDSQGAILGSAAERSPRIEPDERTFCYRLTDSIRITQADVRSIQLAKAALRAGIELLMEHAQLSHIDEVRLAGAFGAHIDPVHAMVLGLIPDCKVDKVTAVGNAAGSGAVRALLSRSQRREMEAAVSRVTKIETATEPRFQELFVAALAFPHLTAPSTNLAEVVTLPERTEAGPGDRPRRRRNRRSQQ